MAKKSSTIHIENCFWDLIEDYQNKNGMASRNTAIECILSEYKALRKFPSSKIASEPIDEEKTNEVDEMQSKIDNLEDDMPE